VTASAADGPSVGVFRLQYPVVSEAFIREQVGAMRRYRPIIVARSWTGGAASAAGAGSPPRVLVGGGASGVRGRLARTAYAATASPRLFARARTGWPPLALIHAHFGPDASYALPLAEQLGVPLIATFHGWDVTLPDRSYRWRGSLTTWQYLLRRDALRAHGAAFVAVSDYIRGRLLALGFPADRIVRLYVGVDVDAFHPASEPAAERYIFSAARHTPQKGVETLLRAFARIAPRFPDLHLVQVGAGPLTGRLHHVAGRLGIAGRVRFLGAQPHEVVRRLMQQAALVALTSETPPNGQQEALGLVLNEAGACGLPVVATRHGGMPEAVIDGETGLLRAERDERGIADAFTALLSDRALAERMGERGRALVGDVFNLRTQTAALEALYDRVSAGAPPAG